MVCTPEDAEKGTTDEETPTRRCAGLLRTRVRDRLRIQLQQLYDELK